MTQSMTKGMPEQKRVYQAPKLSSYGSFQTVTLGTVGTKNDGGGRLTKP
jgi:hypothetical protein